MKNYLFGILVMGSVFTWSCTTGTAGNDSSAAALADTLGGKVRKTEAQWKAQLSSKAYYVLREGGTEWPYSSKLAKNKARGTYVCAGCGNPLFSSETKYESGTGWPSFYAPIQKSSVFEHADRSLGMTRTEILCAKCNGHLGHVFDDGPKPTGLRYCMNGVAMEFVPEEKTIAGQ